MMKNVSVKVLGGTSKLFTVLLAVVVLLIMGGNSRLNTILAVLSLAYALSTWMCSLKFNEASTKNFTGKVLPWSDEQALFNRPAFRNFKANDIAEGLFGIVAALGFTICVFAMKNDLKDKYAMAYYFLLFVMGITVSISFKSLKERANNKLEFLTHGHVVSICEEVAQHSFFHTKGTAFVVSCGKEEIKVFVGESSLAKTASIHAIKEGDLVMIHSFDGKTLHLVP